MKFWGTSKIISVICSAIGLAISLYYLVIGLQSIGSSSWGGLGVILILPTIIALLIITLDLAITFGKIKNGLIFSCVSSAIKNFLMTFFVSRAIKDFKFQLKYGTSNFIVDILAVMSLIIVALPSVFNIIDVLSHKK